MPPANKPKHQTNTEAVRVLELDPCKVLTKPYPCNRSADLR